MTSPLAAYQARVAAGELAADAHQRRAALRLERLAVELATWNPDAWFKRQAPRGIYLWGPVGRGKSMLLDLFFETAPVRKKRRVHFHEFMLAQHAFMRRAREQAPVGQDDLIAAAAREVANQARLLCFDEVQVTDIADAMILGRLFERLFAEDVVIVATSNRPPGDLYKNGLNRQLFQPFIDQIKARIDLVEVGGAVDYRLERLMAAPVYYAPLGPAADQAMERAFVRLTHGAAPHGVTLDVGGRDLYVAKQAAGVARLSFEELCARPLGAADYLELAERFHTVLLENIPRLTPSMREEAARFRILVDALYEAKTKLIASAEAEPSELYPTGDQRFEFERTASRLMEMRSQAYLALPRRDAEWKQAIVEA